MKILLWMVWTLGPITENYNSNKSNNAKEDPKEGASIEIGLNLINTFIIS